MKRRPRRVLMWSGAAFVLCSAFVQQPLPEPRQPGAVQVGAVPAPSPTPMPEQAPAHAEWATLFWHRR